MASQEKWEKEMKSSAKLCVMLPQHLGKLKSRVEEALSIQYVWNMYAKFSNFVFKVL